MKTSRRWYGVPGSITSYGRNRLSSQTSVSDAAAYRAGPSKMKGILVEEFGRSRDLVGIGTR